MVHAAWCMVHAFLKLLIPCLRRDYSRLQRIIYFSDGCAAQYKNRYNFINLYYHEHDFGLQAEWNFFATSHGKNACDGIGGTLKRAAARASLQRPVDNQILTPKDLFEYCHTSISSIKSFFVTSQEVEQVTISLAERRKFQQDATILSAEPSYPFG